MDRQRRPRRRTVLARDLLLLTQYELASQCIIELRIIQESNRRRITGDTLRLVDRAFYSIRPDLRAGLTLVHARRARAAFIRLCVNLGVNDSHFDTHTRL